MPYYVFSVKPLGRIEKLAEFGGFKDASAHAKALRSAQTENVHSAQTENVRSAQIETSRATLTGNPRVAGAGAAEPKIKVMFADNEDLAIELLCQVREPGPTGDD